jgi:hypothetical protein
MLGLEELVITEPCTLIYSKMFIELGNKNGTLAISEAISDAHVVKIVDQCNGWI